MEISLDWLADFVDIPALDVVCDKLQRAGIEIEAVSDPTAKVKGVIVGEVASVAPHPKADRLHVCEVLDGVRRYTVVCGAPNVAVGQRVAFAPVGAEAGFPITRRTLRGVASEGMICSRAELGLEEKSDGIWVLPGSFQLGADVLAQAKVTPRLTLAIGANRPDLLSHIGIARELAAATGKRLKAATWRVTEKGPECASLARVLVEDAGCKRYIARVVRNVKVGPSPAWLRERLERVGQRSINNVVDATNYVMLELGQPLHAFDLARLAVETGLPTIRVRAAKSAEKITTLDGVERPLDPEDLVIADAERPMALAGIMGGADSEVTPETTTVLIESAHFDPVRIRAGSKRHGLHSESSHRFERCTDPGMVVKAADRCAQILAEAAGGEVAKGVVEVSQKPEPQREIALRLERVPRLLGVAISTETVVQLLDPLEIRCVARNEGGLRFQPPSFRPDLTREIDLLEELARRYGYEQIPERLPGVAGDFVYEPLPRSDEEKARRAMLASGVSEAVTWIFGSPAIYREYGEGGEEPLRLLNPLGEELSALRTSLLPGLLTALLHNQRHGARHVRLFEIGRTIHPRPADPSLDERDRDLPREVRRIACLLWGGRHLGRWWERGETVDFTDLAGVLDNLCDELELAAPVVRVPAVIKGLSPQAAAELRVGDAVVGTAGVLHPDRAAAAGVSGLVLVAELSLDALAAVPQRPIRFEPLPKFPGTRRDVAVVAPRTLPSEEVRCFLAAHAGGALGEGVVERVRLFDVYQGAPVPETHVSLAYAIEYRSNDRTLTDDEVGAAFEAAIDKLQRELNVEVRRQ